MIDRFLIRVWHEIFVGHGQHLEVGRWYARCRPCVRAWVLNETVDKKLGKLLGPELSQVRADMICKEEDVPGFGYNKEGGTNENQPTNSRGN